MSLTLFHNEMPYKLSYKNDTWTSDDLSDDFIDLIKNYTISDKKIISDIFTEFSNEEGSSSSPEQPSNINTKEELHHNEHIQQLFEDCKSFILKTNHPDSQCNPRNKRNLHEIKILEEKKIPYQLIDDKINNIIVFYKPTFDIDENKIIKNILDTKYKGIVIQFIFPLSYPHDPPLVRILTPKFKFMTGHVTIDGAICNELFMASGWSPVMDIEKQLLAIEIAMTQDGQLDSDRMKNEGLFYEPGKIRESIRRMAASHNDNHWFINK